MSEGYEVPTELPGSTGFYSVLFNSYSTTYYSTWYNLPDILHVHCKYYKSLLMDLSGEWLFLVPGIIRSLASRRQKKSAEKSGGGLFIYSFFAYVYDELGPREGSIFQFACASKYYDE